MSENPPAPPNPPKEEPKTPAKVEDKPKDDDLLSILEKDFIEKLKEKVNLEDFADLDQKTRIKTFRALEKTLSKQVQDPPAAKKDDKKVEQKGQATDPAAEPPPQDNHIPTLLERNNMKDYLNDVRQKNSILNITDRIRGKTAKK